MVRLSVLANKQESPVAGEGKRIDPGWLDVRAMPDPREDRGSAVVMPGVHELRHRTLAIRTGHCCRAAQRRRRPACGSHAGRLDGAARKYNRLVLDDVLAAYDSAWNEPDPAVRAQLLARSLAEDAELVDPTRGRFNGREAINERIAGFSARFPGAQLTLTSGVDEHNGFARYTWAINAADGSLILEGIDVVERDDDNRLRRVVMFFGPLSPAAE